MTDKRLFKYSIGNSKIGTNTLIFNITSATDCVSRKLGICQLSDPNKCYALKSEKMYPSVLPYRRSQAEYWRKTSTQEKINDITIALIRHKSIKFVRINEAGDLRSQADIETIKTISQKIPYVTFYLYTARKDLNLSHNVKNLVITGSGFMADNSFNVAYTKTKGTFCPGACENCMLCKQRKGKEIKVLIH